MIGPTDRTALLVLDIQNGLCDPRGSLSALGLDARGCAAAIGPCRTLVAAARERNVPVIYCTTELPAGTIPPGSLSRVAEVSGLAPGTWDAEIIDLLKPEAGDYRVVKHRWNAFYGTPLDSLLFDLRVETVITIGVRTNLSVQSTVRDSAHRDYRNCVVSDATADVSEERHVRALRALEWAFCTVVSTQQVLSAWGAE
jgi:ureidoacrylate peracid hydrolase